MEEEFSFNLANFDGPLDLLLSLVKDKRVDILDVDLAELATAYLAMINSLKGKNIDLASEYLVMAATLLHLKSKILLENPADEKEIVDEKENLLRQLSEYQQYKLVAKQLREKEISRKDIFIKKTSSYDSFQPQIDESKLYGHSDAIKLITSLRKMFERTNASKLRQTTIEAFNLSPAERRLELIILFKENVHPTFNDIFSVPTINHFVVTLLTVLDMARKQELVILQENQFGQIIITKGEINE